MCMPVCQQIPVNPEESRKLRVVLKTSHDARSASMGSDRSTSVLQSDNSAYVTASHQTAIELYHLGALACSNPVKAELTR